MTGVAKTGLYLVGIGSFASIGLDLINRIFPQATAGLAAQLRAPVGVVAAPIRVRPVGQLVPPVRPAPPIPAPLVPVKSF